MRKDMAKIMWDRSRLGQRGNPAIRRLRRQSVYRDVPKQMGMKGKKYSGYSDYRIQNINMNPMIRYLDKQVRLGKKWDAIWRLMPARNSAMMVSIILWLVGTEDRELTGTYYVDPSGALCKSHSRPWRVRTPAPPAHKLDDIVCLRGIHYRLVSGPDIFGVWHKRQLSKKELRERKYEKA